MDIFETQINTSLITFKQHTNEYKRGGMELDYCFEHNTVPKVWEDFKGNRLENHKNSFIPNLGNAIRSVISINTAIRVEILTTIG